MFPKPSCGALLIVWWGESPHPHVRFRLEPRIATTLRHYADGKWVKRDQPRLEVGYEPRWKRVLGRADGPLFGVERKDVPPGSFAPELPRPRSRLGLIGCTDGDEERAGAVEVVCGDREP